MDVIFTVRWFPFAKLKYLMVILFQPILPCVCAEAERGCCFCDLSFNGFESHETSAATITTIDQWLRMVLLSKMEAAVPVLFSGRSIFVNLLSTVLQDVSFCLYAGTPRGRLAGR